MSKGDFVEFQKRKIKLFILSGKAKSGKSAVANIIQKYYGKRCITISYAYYIKDYLIRMGMYDETNKEQYRKLLQDFGSILLHNRIDDELLIRRVCEDIEVFSYFYDIIVITDARLLPEIEIPKEKYKDAIVLRITSNTRHIEEERQQHITETALDMYSGFDYIIENNDDLKTLRENVISILKGVK